jgi:cobalt-zinc-cadmium efflux system membrane fusion protein
MKSFLLTGLTLLLLCACGAKEPPAPGHHGASAAADYARGPHNGRLLSNGPFAIELAIFESGVPPEYHAWPTLEGRAVPLDQVELVVELTRLNGRVDRFTFTPREDYLLGSGVVQEPHSFQVKVIATHAGQSHEWAYDSFEGRTTIANEIAEAAGIKTETAGPATLVTTTTLYGRIVPDPTRQRDVAARFPGVIQAVQKQLGDVVRNGETLAVVESNDSLRPYNVVAPIGGVVTARNANPGEQTAGQPLFTIVDPSAVVAELSVFPADRARIRPGAKVLVKTAQDAAQVAGQVDRIEMQTSANQAVIARVSLKNPDQQFLPGAFVTGEVQIASREVSLAVRTIGLQPFRDFEVVFERIGSTYEVRMLELGERYGEWAEVLGGLEPGAEYVTENSYLIKADVEKSGASHDH